MKLSKKHEKMITEGIQKQFEQYEALILNPEDADAIDELDGTCFICDAVMEVTSGLECYKCMVCPLATAGVGYGCITVLRQRFRDIVIQDWAHTHSIEYRIEVTKARLAEMVKRIEKNGWEYK
jgi:hypothetical protein